MSAAEKASTPGEVDVLLEIAELRAELVEGHDSGFAFMALMMGLGRDDDDNEATFRWLFDALVAADPNRVLRALRNRKTRHAEARAAREVQEAERGTRETAEETRRRERREASREGWARWLDEGGRDALASWQPTESTPETCDAVWWAIGPDGNVAGVGPTVAEAHRDANRWAFENLVDPAEAAASFDSVEDTGFRGVLPSFVYTAEDLQFLRVEGSEPALAFKAGRKISGYDR